MICLPASIPPVKSTLRTCLFSNSSAPTASTGPLTTLRTPGGSASLMSFSVRVVASGAVGGTLMTTVLPPSSAWGSLAPMIDSGQL